jgi:hypothetical protein
MQKLLDDFKLNNQDDWERVIKIKGRRKNSIQDSDQQYIKYLEFNDAGNDNDDGFITIESSSRLNLLRAQREKPYQAPIQPQQAAPAYVPPPSIKTKLKSKVKPQVKGVVQKVKFNDIGVVKSEWLEIDVFGYSSVGKVNINIATEKLLEDQTIPKFDQRFFNIRPNKPIKLKVVNDHHLNPESVFKDVELMNLYNSVTVKEDEYAFFMPDYVFLNLTTISKQDFPYNITVNKNGNKFIMYAELTKDNPLAICKTFNETANRTVAETESEVLNSALETTLIEENFYYNVADGVKDKTPKSNGYYKISLDDTHHIYTDLKLDCVNQKGDKVLIRTLNDDGTNWKNIESKWDDLAMNTVRNNVSRIAQWIMNGILTNSRTVIIGYVNRVKSASDQDHQILKVVQKPLDEFIKLFNFNEVDSFLAVKAVLDGVASVSDNGIYVLHKLAYKNSVKLFRVPQNEE